MPLGGYRGYRGYTFYW